MKNEILYTKRRRLGFTTAYIASEAGVAESVIIAIENDRDTVVEIGLAKRIAHAVNLDYKKLKFVIGHITLFNHYR
jgi:transcriptional regulator with XRE-family HTH domain